MLEKSLIEQWLEDYWKKNISGTKSVSETDKKIQVLINLLLVTGEEEITGGQYQGHSKEKILNQQNQINAVLLKIKPGLFSIMFQSYS